VSVLAAQFLGWEHHLYPDPQAPEDAVENRTVYDMSSVGNALRMSEIKGIIPEYKVVIVSPGYEANLPRYQANKHRSGLHWDTRIRLLAASLYYKNKQPDKVIVGGAKIRKMHDSFANLMRRELIGERQLPESAIESEECTFDTASQVDWIKQNRESVGQSTAIITDPEQAKHFRALLSGFDLDYIDVLSSETIITHFAPKYCRFFERLHHSSYWIRWAARERLLAVATKIIDPQGKRLRIITRRRLSSKR